MLNCGKAFDFWSINFSKQILLTLTSKVLQHYKHLIKPRLYRVLDSDWMAHVPNFQSAAQTESPEENSSLFQISVQCKNVIVAAVTGKQSLQLVAIFFYILRNEKN